MARIRTIKPDFWTDEKIAECSPTARLLFIGSWNFADDNGNLQRSSRKLKLQIFPGDSFDCEPLVQELLGHGLLEEYTVNGDKYLHIKGFTKHQKIDKPSKIALPRRPFDDHSTSPRDVMEGKSKGRVEESKKESLVPAKLPETKSTTPQADQPEEVHAKPKSPQPRKQKLPDDWRPHERHFEKCRELGLDCEQLVSAPNGFRNHHNSRGNVMLDWNAAFFTWIGNAQKFAKNGTGGGHNPANPSIVEIGLRVAARHRAADEQRLRNDGIPPDVPF